MAANARRNRTSVGSDPPNAPSTSSAQALSCLASCDSKPRMRVMVSSGTRVDKSRTMSTSTGVVSGAPAAAAAAAAAGIEPGSLLVTDEEDGEGEVHTKEEDVFRVMHSSSSVSTRASSHWRRGTRTYSPVLFAGGEAAAASSSSSS